MIVAMATASPCDAQSTNAGGHAVDRTDSSATARMLVADRAGVTLPTNPAFSLHRTSLSTDTTETAKNRGAHALVGGVIGAAIGALIGTAIDERLNRKTLNDPYAEKVTVHPAGFLLPPLGAVIGAIVGWHS